ncbi:unnamed protein product [Psylliodes chrysocephalus]|uniref:Uncharacterized protein n=1 Tax=Psylliodes chrysocephalus TaxID=3402493 RepID=A0A9P0D1X9_9CUCU|nr:unnamed protein product [Psylliodes chrysocephala]
MLWQKLFFARLEFENDLVAAEANYYHDCFNSFWKLPTWVKVGRSQDETTNLPMEEIFAYIENCDERQFTLNELGNVCKTRTIDNRTLKVLLKLRYGYKIIIYKKSGTSTFICLVDNHHDILNQAWYEKKKLNKKERLKIFEAAAAIIREDIQSTVLDNSNYPLPGRIFEDLNNEIPKSLTHF